MGRTAPLIGVIMLAVMLIAGIVAMMNSIPLSIKTIYRYSARFCGITPRGDVSETPKIKAQVIANSPVPLERILEIRGAMTQVKSIVGKWPFVVIALRPNDLDYYLKKMDASAVTGRLPYPGEPAAVISEPVARNLGLKLGDTLLGPKLADGYSPKVVRVVGIAQTKLWIMVSDYQYVSENHYPPVDNLLVFTRNAADQVKFDHWAYRAFRGARAQVLAYYLVERDSNNMFKILYKILNVVIGMLVLVITFMMAMLINIYQTQRLVEFGLLQAIGYTKKQLLGRVYRETLIVLAGGWSLGVLAAYALLNVVYKFLFEPQAFAIDTMDLRAFSYTIPVPIAILTIASLTVYWRFRKFDPVAVVERRLV